MIRLAALILCLAVPAVARADFVLSNLRMTLYHELGHAVIDQHEVALFGPEETAADTFALVLAHRLHDEEEMAHLIRDMTRLARLDAPRAFFDPWSEYMTVAQRTAYGICLYYGLAPATRGDLARALGMPGDSARDCEARADSVLAAWTPILDRIVPRGPSRSLRPAVTGKALRVLAKDIDRVNTAVELRRPIPVDYESCGEDNAFYYHWDERIVFCSEMIEALRRHARAP